jgi:replicative DNA helicase
VADDYERRRRSPERDRPAPEPEAEHLFDDAAERCVLGTVLNFGQSAFQAVLDVIGPDDFYHQKHRAIFEAIVALDRAQRAIDFGLVAEQLRVHDTLVSVGGESYVASLIHEGVTSTNVAFYADLVRQKARLREVRAVLRTGLVQVGTPVDDADATISEVAQRFFELTTKHAARGVLSIGEGVKAMISELEQKSRARHHGRYTGVPTGYPVLDNVTNGFQPSDLIILAARPGMGKTAFALNIACNAAMNRDGPIPCVVFSLEMSATQLIQRIWSFHASVPLKSLRSAQIEESDWPKLLQSAQDFGSLPIFVDDTAAITVAEVRNKCRQLKQAHNLGLVIIDYLQLMSPSREHRNSPREQQISDISRNLKGLAKELNVPVIALSQLNRGVEARPDKRPQISDLRESGAIEQDADIILMLYRASYYAQKAQETARKRRDAPDNDARGAAPKGAREDNIFLTMDPDDHATEVLIEKHRAGETGRVRILWIPEFTLFVNLSNDPAPPITDADAPPRMPRPLSVERSFPPPSGDGASEWDQPMHTAPFDDGDRAPPSRAFEPAPLGDDDFDGF